MATFSRDPRAEESAALDRCARCGEPLEPDQEWCLRCGSARTVVHRPPDPRIGAGIVATVALAVLAVVVVAVLAAARTGDGAPSAIRTGVSPSGTATRSSSSAPSGASLASWPVGLSGWTVVLARSTDRATATATAQRLAASGISTGVLDSSQHPHLQPGYFVVFSGRYPDGTSAQAAATALQARGQAQAVAREVVRPGGL